MNEFSLQNCLAGAIMILNPVAEGEKEMNPERAKECLAFVKAAFCQTVHGEMVVQRLIPPEVYKEISR